MALTYNSKTKSLYIGAIFKDGFPDSALFGSLFIHDGRCSLRELRSDVIGLLWPSTWLPELPLRVSPEG